MKPATHVLNRAELARISRLYTVDPDTGCWLWNGERSTNGYARWQRGPGHPTRAAHRTMWEHLNGPVPDGMQLDHRCRTRNCINPLHLEPVTPSENTRRQDHANRNKTECPQGHPYTPENTYIDKKGRRNCRACRRKAT